MTVPSTLRKAGPLFGNGVATSFPFSFKVFGDGDVAVVLTTAAGVATTLVLDSDYTVSRNTNQESSPGGAITYPVSGSPLPAGDSLTVVGDIDYDQTLDLPAGGNFSPEAIEAALDRMSMQIQQLRELTGRALFAPVSDTVEAVLPGAAARASKYLAFDADGKPMATSSGGVGPVVSAFMETVLDDDDAAAARATLDVPTRTGGNASGTWDVSITGTAENLSRSVTGAGLAAGGGALTNDQTITVTKSTQVQAEAGTDDSTAMTPLRTKQAITAHTPSETQGIYSYTDTQRVTGTAYQNTTGRSISVYLKGGGGAVAEISTNNSTWFRTGFFQSDVSGGSVSMTVQNGWYYRVTGTFNRYTDAWVEVR